MASKFYKIIQSDSKMSADSDKVVLGEIYDRTEAQAIRDNLQEYAPKGRRFYVMPYSAEESSI